MSQAHLTYSLDKLFADSILWNLRRRGISDLDNLSVPRNPQAILRPRAFPLHHHRCSVEEEELYYEGIPIFKRIGIPVYGASQYCIDELRRGPYWSGPILLLHEGRNPDSREWYPLGLAQAACLLGINPELGAVRFRMPDGRSWEIFIAPDGNIYVWPGDTHHEHHAAYTTQPCPNHSIFFE